MLAKYTKALVALIVAAAGGLTAAGVAVSQGASTAVIWLAAAAAALTGLATALSPANKVPDPPA